MTIKRMSRCARCHIRFHHARVCCQKCYAEYGRIRLTNPYYRLRSPKIYQKIENAIVSLKEIFGDTFDYLEGTLSFEEIGEMASRLVYEQRNGKNT